MRAADMSSVEGTDDSRSLECRVEDALRDGGSNAPHLDLIQELYERYRTQSRLLDRLVHISDRFQLAEREHSKRHVDYYHRKLRQIEKMVRISDTYQAMLRDLNQRLQTISTHDDLTGLPNRRFMRDRLGQEVARVAREEGCFSMALIDVDFFKKINDSFGHAGGDEVLTRIAGTLRASLREYDVCARWGGEEFLVLFPGADEAEAVILGNRLRHAVTAYCTMDLMPPLTAKAGPRVTLSIGVTQYRPGEELDDILRRVDLAMYDAKGNGRDQVVMR